MEFGIEGQPRMERLVGEPDRHPGSGCTLAEDVQPPGGVGQAHLSITDEAPQQIGQEPHGAATSYSDPAAMMAHACHDARPSPSKAA